MRPNKTNFGLSLGHFGGSYVKERKEEKKKKNKRKGMESLSMETMFLYGFMTLSMETRDLYGDVWISKIWYDGYGFGRILVCSISRV